MPFPPLRRVLVTLIVATFTGLVTANAAAPAAPGQRVSRDWKRLLSDDLEVVGNASEKELRRTFAEVENFRRTVKAVASGIDAKSSQKTILIVLRDPGSFERFLPRDGRGRRQNVGGYFTVVPYANVMVLPLLRDRELTYQVAFHEYTHYLAYRSLRNIPAWLNEGLADLYSTVFIDDEGRSIIGRAPAGRVATLRSRPLWPLAKFLNPETAARLFEDESDTSQFYAQAWALVHFLTLGDQGSRQGQLRRYLEALQSSPSQMAAAQLAFGDDLTRVDRELRRYLHGVQLPALAIKPPQPEGTMEPVVERLLEVDALHIQARLLADLGAAKDAEETVEKLLRLDPAHPGAHVVLGRIRLQQERTDEAVAFLSQAAAGHPESFDVHYYLAEALGSEDRHRESLQAYDRAIALNRESHFAWLGLSRAALALERDAQSDAAMLEVQRLYSDPSWFYASSRFALGLGRNERAARDAALFLQYAGWGDTSAPYAAFVGAIAHRRLEQRAEADALLAKAARGVMPKSWAASVVAFLQNQLSDDAFLDRAKDNGQRTEAHAYIGMKAVDAGQIEAARKHFLWVKERGDRHYTEYGLALAELKRLRKR